MYLKALILLTCLSLCSFSSCEDDCFDVYVFTTLSVELENPGRQTYVPGDTLWLSADFSADLSDNGRAVRISETGGLIVTRLFRIGQDSTTLLAARSAVTPFATQGNFTFEAENQDPAAIILRYTCPDGRCAFRQGFRLDSVGQYLLQVHGSAYDLAEGAFMRCADNSFTETKLEAPSNLAGVPLNYPLNYSDGNSFGSSAIIDTSFFNNQNLLLINVE